MKYQKFRLANFDYFYITDKTKQEMQNQVFTYNPNTLAMVMNYLPLFNDYDECVPLSGT